VFQLALALMGPPGQNPAEFTSDLLRAPAILKDASINRQIAQRLL